MNILRVIVKQHVAGNKFKTAKLYTSETMFK